MHTERGEMFQTDLLNQLQTIQYIKGEDMRTHLGSMNTIHECLAETGSHLTDNSFNTYIRTSLSLTTCFWSLFTTLNTNACQNRRKISSIDLIWHLTEESNNTMIEDQINQANIAMAAAMTKATGTSCNQDSKGKGKRKKCTNCKKTRHGKEDCFEKGGGKADNPLDWWKWQMEWTYFSFFPLFLFKLVHGLLKLLLCL